MHFRSALLQRRIIEEPAKTAHLNMNVHQMNKVDISSLAPEEQRLFRLYGKLPSKFEHPKERKYFDSGDYALSKAGKVKSVDTESVGAQHPLPENIPHLTFPGAGIASQGGSGNSNIHQGVAGGSQSVGPVKESSFLNKETNVDELENEGNVDNKADSNNGYPLAKDRIPVGI